MLMLTPFFQSKIQRKYTRLRLDGQVGINSIYSPRAGPATGEAGTGALT